MTSSTNKPHQSEGCLAGKDEPTEHDVVASVRATPTPHDLARFAAVQKKLISHAERSNLEKEVRQRTTRAVVHALYGEGGAACHAMTGDVLDILIEEASVGATEGVIGAQEVLWALEDAHKTASTALSEWHTYCRQK
jgi:hypothetical protein